MLNYEEIKLNQNIIKEFCKKYRKELTITGGLLGEKLEQVNYSDYVKFFDELTIEEFTVNYYIGLFNKDVIQIYKDILEGKMNYDEYLKSELEDIYEDYLDKLNN